GRPNVLTLSCKNRLTRLPREAARLLPRQTRSGGSELQRTCRARAVRAAQGGSPPGQRTGGFCQLVRAVGPPSAWALTYGFEARESYLRVQLRPPRKLTLLRIPRRACAADA